MRNNYLFLFLFLPILAIQSQVGTDFEEPIGGTIDYSDPDFSTIHQLPNNASPQPSVNYINSGGSELGFTTVFTPSRTGAAGTTGLSDGDLLGVNTNATIISRTDVTSWTSGNAYAIEDTDGMVTVSFDAVDLTGTITPRFQMDLWVDGTTYEQGNGSNDRIYIALEVNGGASTIVIFDSDGGGSGGGSGGDLDTATYNGTLVESNLTSIDEDLSSLIGSTVKLIIEGDFDSSSEKVVFDNILFTEGAIVLPDTTNPQVQSITRQTPTTSPTNADALTFAVEFTETVVNVNAADFSIGSTTTATITNVADLGSNVWGVTISGGDLAGFNGTVTLGFVNNQDIEDSAGNALTDTTPIDPFPENFLVDNIGPGITSIVRQSPTTSPTNADVLVWDVTFDGDVSNVDATDFAVIGTTATIASVTNPSGNTYRATVSGGNLASLNGTVTLGFAGGQNISDDAGNALTNLTPTGTNNNTFVLDNIEPGITSIVRQSPTTSPTNADVLVWDVAFDVAVSNVDAADFAVTGTTATIASVTNPSGNVYRVTVSGGDLAGLNGTVTLGFAGGQNITDAVGNPLTNLTPTGTNNNTFVVDNAGPTVSSVSSSTANGTYNIGDSVTVTLTFSDIVTVTGTPQLTLETGTTDRTINYNGTGSGTTTLEFTYTVQAGDISTDLDYVGTSSLTAGTSIQDALGNEATLTLPTPGAANSLGANKAIVIDGVTPTVTSVSATTANGTYGIGDSVVVTVTFSEAVTVTGTPQLTLETGTTDRTIDYNGTGSGTTTLEFTYTVQAGDTSADLDYVATNSLIAGTTIQDAAGNDATLTLATPGATNSLGDNKAIVIDGNAPSVTITSSESPGPTGASPIPVTITFSESVSNFVIGDLTVGNGTPGNFAGSGTTYTVDISPTAAGVVTVDINANVAIDGTGNGNTAATQFSITYDNVLGIDDELLANGLTIYPMPSNNIINISGETKLALKRAEIFDIQGKLILSQKLDANSSTNTIDISSIRSGMYLMTIHSETGGRSTERIIKL